MKIMFEQCGMIMLV